jgi:hypothetical protein
MNSSADPNITTSISIDSRRFAIPCRAMKSSSTTATKGLRFVIAAFIVIAIGTRAASREAPSPGTSRDLAVYISQRDSQYLFTAYALALVVSAKQLLECANSAAFDAAAGRLGEALVKTPGLEFSIADLIATMQAGKQVRP